LLTCIAPSVVSSRWSTLFAPPAIHSNIYGTTIFAKALFLVLWAVQDHLTRGGCGIQTGLAVLQSCTPGVSCISIEEGVVLHCIGSLRGGNVMTFLKNQALKRKQKLARAQWAASNNKKPTYGPSSDQATEKS
jgi:hypothetical protein